MAIGYGHAGDEVRAHGLVLVFEDNDGSDRLVLATARLLQQEIADMEAPGGCDSRLNAA
ncbi:MAG: hypothetical protein ACRD2Z_10650 [Thermoanaerobaculia bacterium]